MEKWKKCLMRTMASKNSALMRTFLSSRNVILLDFQTPLSTPLTAALKTGQHDVVKQLLEAGANVNFTEQDGTTPLMVAVSTGSLDMCQLLINNGASVSKSRVSDQHNALHLATRCGYYDIVVLLLQHGAELYDRTKPWDILKTSPLVTTIRWNQPRILELYLDHFAKPQIRLSLEIVFDLTIQYQNEDCAIVILKYGYYPCHKQNATILKKYISFFSLAAQCGLVRLMEIMISMNPYFLQEQWLVRNQIPHKLNRHAKFVQRIQKCRKQPPRLKQLCRSAILAQMAPKYKTKLTKLPSVAKELTKYLQDFEMV